MIDPTEDELSFLRKLEWRSPLVLRGNMRLLQIERLIPEYITFVSSSADTGVFNLTTKGRLLLQTVDQDRPG